VSILVACHPALAPEPTTGPQTEKRFPPLQVPDGFRATLFACDPLIEYPSVIAPGFRTGTLLVAVDFMTGLGTEIDRRDEIRLLEDTDGDGYADKATVFATGFNSIQGLAQHNGTVYVMHAPYLTALRDTRKTGKADERRDLIIGLGLPPEQDPIRLHNANGVVVGHDGWLYLALGDRGCIVTRPEGDKLVLEGGGVLRCRPDGRDLHVFSRGLRNIYDVALDEDLNVFVRDNENDGGTYKVRLYHSFFGADHGYPYLYDERPDEALRPIAELGLGAPAGGVCYLEAQFPGEYRGNLLFCEWGRAVVRSQLKRTDASFSLQKESDFAAGAANDPYGFKPTDLVVDRDGTLFISDWADGQRPKRGRGRIYHVQYVGKGAERQLWFATDPDTFPVDVLVRALDSASHWRRRTVQEALERRGKEGLGAVQQSLSDRKLGVSGRLHAVWILAKVQGREALDQLLDLATTDAEPRVRAQALRAVADLTDPVLVNHRLDAGRGDEAVARRIADLAGKTDCDPRVQLEAIIALGRLRWSDASAFFQKTLKKPDPAVAQAVQWTLRQAGDWQAVVKLLDLPAGEPLRAIALRALAGQYEVAIVDGLAERLAQETDAARRREYADLLTRVYKKPPPWVYWGFRPAPRPANNGPWERTERIARTLDSELVRLDANGRTALLRRMVREKIPATTAALAKILEHEHELERVAVLLTALADLPAQDAVPLLENVLRDQKHASGNRLLAASAYLRGIKKEDEKGLIGTAEAVEDGPVLAELLRAIGARKARTGTTLLLRKATSASAEVRARVAEALAEIGAPESRSAVQKLLDDPDARVRAAAALAAGKLKLQSASGRLLELARDPGAEGRAAALTSLRQLGERRGLPHAISALSARETAPAALDYIARLGGPEHVESVVEVARREPSVDMVAAVGKVLTDWLRRDGLTPRERLRLRQALAKLHGASGALVVWSVRGPISPDQAAKLLPKLTAAEAPAAMDLTSEWPVLLATGMEGRAQLGAAKNASDLWLAFAEVEAVELSRVEFSTTSTGLETVWLNEKVIFERKKAAAKDASPDRVEANLVKGSNRILVRLNDVRERAEFQLRFRRMSAVPQRERLAAAALARSGNVTRGREVFLNAEKSQCTKCHRVGDVGERYGPELTGLGSRFSKVYIIESILEPSRAISPSFEGTIIDLKDGRRLTGLRIEEDDAKLVILDGQARKLAVPKADIESRGKSTVSPMPEGMENSLTEDEFVDLVSYLVSLKAERKN
jgi:putative membrane-bound dehydrogenase-like protein